MRLVLLRYLHFICIFMDAIKSELLALTFQSDILRIWVHIKLSPFYYKANVLTNWDSHPYPPLSIYHTYPALPLATTCPLIVSQNVKEIRDASFFFFTRDWKKNNKKQFPSVEVGNVFRSYINIKWEYR